MCGRPTEGAYRSACTPLGFEEGFVGGGLLLIAGGLIALMTMNPQRSAERLARSAARAEAAPQVRPDPL